jgi:hypothetical protein
VIARTGYLSCLHAYRTLSSRAFGCGVIEVADGNTIAAIARANLGKMYDSVNSAGGTGYYSSVTGEAWCADFAKWCWAQAGADVSGLDPGAVSFAQYGTLGASPQVGDAVVFGVNESTTYAQHVALVVAVDGGSIMSIGGDEGTESPPQNHVQEDGWYSSALGPSSYWGAGFPISGYVSPKGLAPPAGRTVRSSAQVPPVVSWAPDSLYAFAVAADDSIEYRAWDGKSWSAWGNLGGTVSPAYPTPAPVAWRAGRLAVFCVGGDGNLYHKGWDGTQWSAAWDNLENSGEAPASAPSAVGQQDNSLDVFVMGQRRQTIWRRSWSGSWAGWSSLGEIASASGSAPVACTWGSGRLDVCVVGANKTLMHSGWDGGAWSGGWQDIGGNPAYDPALISWGPGRLDAFIVGTDGNLWHNVWNGNWLGWQNMGTPGETPSSAPVAVSQAENSIDVFVMGRRHQTIWRRSWNGASWSAWESLGQIASSDDATPVVAAWGPGRLDAFVQGAANSIYHSGWGGGAWSGSWEDLGGDVKFF